MTDGTTLVEKASGLVEIHDPDLKEKVRQYLADIASDDATSPSEEAPLSTGKRRGRPPGSKSPTKTPTEGTEPGVDLAALTAPYAPELPTGNGNSPL